MPLLLLPVPLPVEPEDEPFRLCFLSFLSWEEEESVLPLLPVPEPYPEEPDVEPLPEP